MPNWCASRIYFDPKSGFTVEQARAAMDSSGFNELMAHGVHSARALFLLVFSGVIRVRGECYGREPLTWMTKYGGARIDLNRPIDHEASDLVGLLNGVFDTEKLACLVAFATSRRWFDTVDQLNEVTVDSTCWQQSIDLFKVVLHDYSHTYDYATRESNINDIYFKWLNYFYDRPEPKVEEIAQVAEPGVGYHLMASVLPTHVLPEINGFNGNLRTYANEKRGLLDRFAAYGSNVTHFGTKWPGFEFRASEKDGHVFLDFETAWSPPNEEYFDALSERIPQLNEIYYAEQGVGFCGSGVAIEPGVVAWRSGDLEIEYTELEGQPYVCEVTNVSPGWIKDKVGSYGG